MQHDFMAWITLAARALMNSGIDRETVRQDIDEGLDWWRTRFDAGDTVEEAVEAALASA